MRYYPVVGTIKYEDKIFSLSISIMAQIIHKKMVRCQNPGCGAHVLYSKLVRARAIMSGWQTMQSRTPPTTIAREPRKLECHCGSDLIVREDVPAIKLYLYLDKRVETNWDLFHGLIVCDQPSKFFAPAKHTQLPLNLRVSQFKRNMCTRKELFVLFEDYEEFRRAVSTLNLKQKREKGLKFKASWTLKAIPTEAELHEALCKYKLRKLADRI